MLHMLAVSFKCFASVSDIRCKCFIYFGCMLQMFHLDILQSRSGIAHVAMHVRSGGGANGPHVQSGRVGDV
jgi:hypothetical protein